MVIGRLLSRIIFCVMVIGCSGALGQNESNKCKDALDGRQLELYDKTESRIVNLSAPEIPTSQKAMRAVQENENLGFDGAHIACVSLRFDIDAKGKAHNIKIINAFPSQGFLRSATKSIENSYFRYEKGGCNAGLYIVNYSIVNR